MPERKAENPAHRRLAGRERLSEDEDELTVMVGFYLPESVRDRIRDLSKGNVSAWVRRHVLAALERESLQAVAGSAVSCSLGNVDVSPVGVSEGSPREPAQVST